VDYLTATLNDNNYAASKNWTISESGRLWKIATATQYEKRNLQSGIGVQM
jgi:hypothetical protein